MSITKINGLNAGQSRASIVSDLSTTPQIHYGTGTHDVDSVEWRGGEIEYLSTDNRFYIQTASSGTTAVWKRYLNATTT